jgi:transcriptional regulator of acetoin/glycerol metabolism
MANLVRGLPTSPSVRPIDLRTRDHQVLLAQSWQRCKEQYKLDPSQRRRYNVLTRAEIRDRRTPLEGVMRVVGDQVAHLDSLVGEAGYDSLFADSSGVILDRRGSPCDRAKSRYSEPIGSVWREDIEGTNAVGTCAAEAAPVGVWKGEHFLHQYGGLSCAAAPVRNPKGELIGILNITGADSSITEDVHRLCFGIVRKIARRVERKLFRELHQTNWLIGLRLQDQDMGLLAVDGDYQIVGLDYLARKFLNPLNKPAEGESLWRFFERNTAILSSSGAEAGQATLTKVSTRSRVSAQIRCPVEARHAPRKPDRGDAVAPPRGATPSRFDGPSLDECAGSDPQMCENVVLLRRVVDSSLTILLVGETGTGKDAIACGLHFESARAARPFVAINCAAIPEELIDSELFGYSKGAYTGARPEGSAGRIVEADGGTLFLDEIGDMPLPLQTRLLRFLENGEVLPLGGGRVRRVNAQVIAATNRNLELALSSGNFRSDLYHRLAGIVVRLPPLRERRDLDQLISRLLHLEGHGRTMTIEAAAMTALLSHSWPGNIRELRNVLRRAVSLADQDLILLEHLQLANGSPMHLRADLSEPGGQDGVADSGARAVIASAERAAIAAALRRFSSDMTACAQSLGISRATLYRKIRRYQLK